MTDAPEMDISMTLDRDKFQANGKTTQRKKTMPEPKKRSPFRIEEDWFAFVVGILIAFAVFLGWIQHVPW